MKILALDLATTTGFALGASRASLVIGHWDCSAEHPDLVPGRLGYKLRVLFKEHGAPDFMSIEKTLPPFAQKHQKTIQSQERLHGAALCVAGMYCVPRVAEYPPDTIRKHFIGRANCGDRDATKAEVFKRARILGYKPKTLDESDAVALWDYTNFSVLKKPGEKFALFGG